MEGCTRCDNVVDLPQGPQKLKCHYCGYTVPPVMKCSACGGESVLHHGLVQNKLQKKRRLFPKARVKRMDLDTTRGKHAFLNLFSLLKMVRSIYWLGHRWSLRVWILTE